jgi:hypothetical protein
MCIKNEIEDQKTTKDFGNERNNIHASHLSDFDRTEHMRHMT